MLHRFLPAVFLVTGALLAQTASAQAQAPVRTGITRVQSVEGIDEYRLANGLQLLLIPDDSKPTTTVNMTYHVGSRMENYGETGMAHLLEHLMFKGAPNHRNIPQQFSERGIDRKSTRLNSSHITISYAVFCLDRKSVV